MELVIALLVAGAILLVLNLLLVLRAEQLGMSSGLAVRLSLLSAGLWWGGFTLITAATFNSADGWREHHEEFDRAKATPPETA